NANTPAAAGRMDKFTLAGVDAYVGDAASSGVEEHKVALLHIGSSYFLALVELFGGRSWETDTFLAIDAAGEPGTVNTAPAGATVAVRNASISVGSPNNV